MHMPNSMETSKLIYRGESETLTRYSIEQRKKIMGSVRRVVVKIGSAVLTGEDGIDLNVIDRLTAEGSWLKAQGRELVLVTSGAISSSDHSTFSNIRALLLALLCWKQ